MQIVSCLNGFPRIAPVSQFSAMDWALAYLTRLF